MPVETATGLDPDPCGLIAAFLALPSPGDTAEAVYVAWLVSLAPPVDPAAAARLLLTRPDLGRGVPESAQRRLVALLDETTRWPRDAIANLTCPCRRGKPT